VPPNIVPERTWGRTHGATFVAGVDEAGRGPLAGPVVAAAVVFDLARPRPVGLDDSKKLSHAKRELLFEEIRKRALAYGIAEATPGEIDAINILEATRLAAKRALAMLDPAPGAIVTDALTLRHEPRPVLPIIKGDAKSASIAAASILAKVTRDRMMSRWAEEFPGYGWERNMGYPTAGHYAAIESLGPTTLHRLSFAGVTFFTVELRWSRTGAALRERAIRGDDVREEFVRVEKELPEIERVELEQLMNG
jgi:ribonuclease HII